MVNDCVWSMAPPSRRASDDAAIGEPDRTMQAPSQPRPRVLQALSVKIEPSRVSLSSLAPAFMRPRAVTNRNSPTTRKNSRTDQGRSTASTGLTTMSSGGSSRPATWATTFRWCSSITDRMQTFPTASVNKGGGK